MVWLARNSTRLTPKAVALLIVRVLKEFASLNKRLALVTLVPVNETLWYDSPPPKNDMPLLVKTKLYVPVKVKLVELILQAAVASKVTVEELKLIVRTLVVVDVNASAEIE